MLVVQKSLQRACRKKVSGSGSAHTVNITNGGITQSFVPVGSYTLKVQPDAPCNVGDRIMVVRTSNKKWLDDLNNMSQWGWLAEDYKVGYEQKVVSKNGNMLTLNAPIVQTIEDQYGGGFVYKFRFPGRINQVGVENLRVESVFDNPTDETHTCVAVELCAVENTWLGK